ncbi:MAG: lysoplasmalogenase, partial [Muribaculaceae bacterium]|nr:lysoplasmalogenase [Muribaculaceae bacterium]
MGGFAIAQICFILQFVKEIRQYIKADVRHKVRSAGIITATVVCLVPFVFAARYILPAVRVVPIRIGCTVYALLLLTSLWTSIVRAFSLKKYIAMIGCSIFLISDFTIAWNKFTEHIPHAGLYIMITYYAALLLIFYGTISRHSASPAGAAGGTVARQLSQT